MEDRVQIVINHLTRMQPGFMCVAGMEVTSRVHIRPVSFGRLPTSLLARNGGPFDMAAAVDLGPVSNVGQPPEVEDRRCNLQRARRITTMSAREFWESLEQAAQPSLAAIFGPDLVASGPACVVSAGSGRASLGCLSPRGKPVLYLNDQGKPRMKLTDGSFFPNLSVTDMRLYKDDHTTPDTAVIENVMDRLQKGVRAIISVGLTRPHSVDGEEAKHYLQVNNIHLHDNPTWQLG